MKGKSLLIIFLFGMTGLLAPISTVGAVNSLGQDGTRKEWRKANREANKRMDTLSLVGYISAVAGIASLFIIPYASLIFLPAAFLMGLIGLNRGREYYKNVRGRGLAVVAAILGGAFTLLFMGSFLLYLVSFGL